jgi:hypothetical protein
VYHIQGVLHVVRKEKAALPFIDPIPCFSKLKTTFVCDHENSICRKEFGSRMDGAWEAERMESGRLLEGMHGVVA